MWNSHWNLGYNPKSNRRSFWPNITIGVSFAVQNANFILLRLSLGISGKTETSAPVSMKNFNYEFRFVMNNRRWLASGAEDIPGVNFLQVCSCSSRMVGHIFWPPCRNACGISNICRMAKPI